MLTLIWSDELIDEIERVLVERKPMSLEAARRWAGHLRAAFPDECVDVTRLPSGIDLAQLTRDPGDEHVCALAIAGRADLLLTMDHGYLAPGLRAYGIDVRKPDDFLTDVFADEPAAVLDALRAQAGVWGGGRPIEALLDALDRAQATGFAALARSMLAS
jgi:predicted nucleic acid-binding protein